MAKATELSTAADAEAMLQASHSGPVLLLKHSASCVASARGHAEFMQLTADDSLPLFMVVVQRASPVSNQLADTLGVRHETPQAIVLRDGQAVLVQNHHRIRAAELRAAAMADPAAS